MVAAVCGGLVALVAMTILVGGATTDSTGFLRWSSELPAPAPIVAIPLLLCAFALASPRVLYRVIAATVAALATASLGASRLMEWDHPAAGWLVNAPVMGEAGDQQLPSATSIRCLLALSVAIGISRSLPRIAQVLVMVPLVVGSLALLAYAYGDRLESIRGSSLPNVWVSAPTALALVIGAIGALALSARRGLSAWFVGGSPGRSTLRGLLPILLVGQVLVVWVAIELDLEEKYGEARASALVVVVLIAATSAVALLAVRRVDRLAADASRAEVLGAQLASAERGLRLATLARSLSNVSTTDEVVVEVADKAAVAVGAQRANLMIEVLNDRAGNDGHPARAEVFRSGQTVLIEGMDEYRARYGAADGRDETLGGAIAVLPVKHRLRTLLGVVTLSWDHRIVFDEAMTSLLRTMSEIVAQSLDRARMTDALSLEARRSAELAHLAEALAGAVTRENVTLGDVLRFLAERVTGPVSALSAAIGIIDRDNRMVHRYFGGDIQSEFTSRYSSGPLDSTMPLVTSARTGETFLFTDLDAVAASHPEALEACSAFGYQAFATLPLRDHNGELFGSLMMGWDRPVRFDDGDRSLLSTIAEMAAQTLERTWLAEGRTRDAERSELLASLARRMTVVSHVADVADIVSEQLAPVLDATKTWLDLLDDPRASERAVAIGKSPRFYVPRPPADSDRSATSVTGARSRMVLPLVADQEVLGIVNAEWDRPIDANGPLRSTLATVGDLLTVTMQRVQLSEAQHRLIEDLQRRALLLAPPMPKLRVAARYQPARIELGMGGDWFQGLALERDQLGLIVGDVVGHGAAAAGDMTQLSGILAALLRVGTPLDELFAVAQEAVGPLDIMATAVVCVIDPEHRLVRHVSAGHPPLVLSDADGTTRLLTDGRSPIVGLPRSKGVVAETYLPVGSTLIAYTDGLVERRREHLDVGFARLQDALAATFELDVEQQIDEVLRRCTSNHQVEDDIALVAVRAVP